MLEEKNNLTEEEWCLYEILHAPVDFVSFFIPKREQSPKTWTPEGDKFKLRLYQKTMLAYDFLLVDDNELSEQENFSRRINLGDGIFIGGRIYGKTLVGIEFDALQEMLVHDGDKHIIYAKDQKHMLPRMEFCAAYVENHKFYQLYELQSKKDTVGRSSTFMIELENGHVTAGVIEGQKSPGEAFQHWHPERKSADEFQQITSLGYSRQVDSKSELGCVERVGGVPDGRRDTPMHEKINDTDLKRFRFRYPSMINPHWNKKREEEAIKKYNGRETHAFKTNVMADEGDVAFGAWDSEDINACVDAKRIPKTFEVSKELFDTCKDDLSRMFILEKPLWAEEIIQASDVGIRPSEMIVMARKKQIWHLIYRIRMMGLIYNEQAVVHDYLATLFNSSCIALDTTEGLGESIAQHLINEKEPSFLGKEYSKRVYRAKFNEKIGMGFLQDAEGKYVIKNGERVEVEEHTDEAAWKLGLSKFRDKLIDLPNDEDLRAQFSAELATQGTNKFVFESPIPNHIISAFKVFFLAEFTRHGKILQDKKPPLGFWV